MTDLSLTRRTLLGSTAAMLAAPSLARAQSPTEVEIALLVPISGMYSRFGEDMRQGGELGVEHINKAGGIKALGAKLKLVILDCGDTTEKAKNAAQRMVAQETKIVAASGAYLSSFTLAVTE